MMIMTMLWFRYALLFLLLTATTLVPSEAFVASPLPTRNAQHGPSRLSTSLSPQRLFLSSNPVDVWTTTSALLDPSTPLLAVYPIHAATTTTMALDAVVAQPTASDLSSQQQQLSNMAIVGIFLAGVLPFAVATVEFWRRIAVGDSFGTGNDSVVFTIGENDAPESSRGRRVLGQGALVIAYVLFAAAALVLALAIASVVTSAPLPAELPVTTTTTTMI